MSIRDLLPMSRPRERAGRQAQSLPARTGSFESMWRDMDSLFASVFGDHPARAGQDGESLTPRLNYSENDTHISIEAEMPGMKEEDIEVTVNQGHLLLRGEKRRESRQDDGNLRRIECSYGRFERAVSLPDYAQPEKCNATYRNGVLHIEIPKDAKRAKAKRIPVKTA